MATSIGNYLKDIRQKKHLTLRQIEEAVREAAAESPGMEVTVTPIFSAPPAVTSDHDPLVRTLQEDVRVVTGQPGVTLVHPAFLDLRWFAVGWGVPVIVYGPGDGGARSGFRTKIYSEPDEYVVVDDLVNATKVLALALVDLVG